MGGGVGPAVRWAGLASGWLAGVGVQLQQAALMAPAATGAIAVAALAGGAALWRWRARPAAAAALVLGAAALGFASTEWRATRALSDALTDELEGRDLVVTGVVAELPRVGPAGTRFVFATEAAQRDGAPVRVPARLALGWYRDADDDPVFGGPPAELRAGQRWRFMVRLKHPHGGLNPHGFDLELALFERGIGATGSVRVRPEALPRKLDDGVAFGLQRLRQSIRDRILDRVADPAAAGVLAALAIGDQAAIDREGWDVFRTTGVAHLMSISGLHVTMFAWLAAALVGRLWRRSRRLMLACPAPQAARWGGLFAALGYALLAGWGVPAQRTVAMIGAVVLLRSAGLRWPMPAVLLAAALAVALVDPWALLQPGFWLSFSAVALLIVSDPGAAAEPPPASRGARLARSARHGLRTQLVATVGLAPLTLLFFQQVSLVGLLANLVAIPLVSLVVAPLSLLGVLLPPLWSLDGWLVQALMALLRALAAWPLALWTAAAAPAWAVACGLLGGVLAVAPLPARLRWLALPLMLPMLSPPIARPPAGRFELVAVDVGQGTAVLVRTRHHLLLFDTGPVYTPEADAGSRVLLPLLRARGETRVDLLMLSHRDSDHVGGAAAVLAALPVASLSSSLADDHPLQAAAAGSRLRCEAGQRWDWDGVAFRVLHPLAADYGRTLKSNAMSCVLQIRPADGVGGWTALLTGDVEAAQEAALIAREGDALRSAVLLVPHHGSRTSSTAGFIDAVAPQVAVVQAGYRSRFGHPAPDVVARYAARGVAVVRSDRCGAWTLQADGSTRCEREAARRYWHHRSAPLAVAAP